MKHLALYLLLLTSVSVYSQTDLDSLFTIWNDPNETVETRMEIMTDLIMNHYTFQNKFDSAHVLADQLYKLCDEQDDEFCRRRALWLHASAYEYSMNYYMAIHEYTRLMKEHLKEGDSSNVALYLIQIAGIYLEQGNYIKALEIVEQSMEIAQLRYEKPDQYIVIGRCYSNLGQHDSAFKYFFEAIDMISLEYREWLYTDLLRSLGDLHQKRDELDSAIYYFKQSGELSEDRNLTANALSAYARLGEVYLSLKNYSQAMIWCRKAEELLDNGYSLKDDKKICNCLYAVYKHIGKDARALEYLEKGNALGDKLRALNIRRELDSLDQVEKDRLQKESHEAEVAKKNKSRNMALGGGLLAMLLAGGFYSRSQYIKKSRDDIAKEKDRSENLLLNILPAEIAAELKERGKAKARTFERVSILFTDFSKFTELSEQLSAEELVEELNHCFEAFDIICGKHGIEKIKTLGDSYMAAGGLPVPHEASALQLTLAALEMTEFVLNRQKERESQGQIPFEMRAGIHTGNVVAGIVGVKKFQYDVWGDTVNTASRMESHGEVGKVNISQATYELVKDDLQFTFEYRGKIEAKGKGEVDMWFVERSSRQARTDIHNN